MTCTNFKTKLKYPPPPQKAILTKFVTMIAKIMVFVLNKTTFWKGFFYSHLGYSFIFTVACHRQVMRGKPPPSRGIVGGNRTKLKNKAFCAQQHT